MISGREIYDVLAGTLPLYVAMMLSYCSTRWWKIFTPDQSSGINRFVAVFALPFLNFYLISRNDPYAMNYLFIAADSLQKVIILGALVLWRAFSKRGSLEWMITFFSISTLPNSLIMGIPILKAMYGDFCVSLMVQLVVMQCVIWFTVLHFLFEYRGAMLLISEQFPETAGRITSFRVDSDVVSLDGREPLQADAEIGGHGKIDVLVRRSSIRASSVISSNDGISPRVSNFPGLEVCSVKSSRKPIPTPSSFNHTDSYAMFTSMAAGSKYTNSFHGGLGGDLASSYPSPNPRFLRSHSDGGIGRQKKESCGCGGTVACDNSNRKKMQMFVCSSPVSEGNMRHGIDGAASADFGGVDSSCNKAPVAFPNDASAASRAAMQDLIENKRPDGKMVNGKKVIDTEEGFSAGGSPFNCQKKTIVEEDGIKEHRMPPASVMIMPTLIMVWRKLIRNPNTYASLLGLVWSLISFRWGIEMPSIVKGSITIMSDTGLGMAMFSLGLFMGLQPKAVACGKSVATFAIAVRFLAGPAVTAATSMAVGLPGTLLRVAIIQAALSQGIVPFIFAKEYNVHADILSTVVFFTLLLAVPVTVLYYVCLEL